MSLVAHPVPTIADHLLLAGLVLDALQCGNMPMHARDYLEISRWAAVELRLLDAPTLRYLQRRAPPSLDTILENLLHERGEAAWAVDVWAQLGAELVWAGLAKRLRP